MARLEAVEWQREELAEPHGILFTGTPSGRLLAGRRVAAVGDMVSHTLMEAGVEPSLVVLDGKTERRPYGRGLDEALAGRELVEVENRAGSIEHDAQETLMELAGEEGVAVLVEGEEDLLAIPLAIGMPEGSLVAYGQPGEGVVLMPVDRYLKSFLQNYLARMRPYPV